MSGQLSIAGDRPSRLCIQTAFFVEIVRQIKLKDLIQDNDRFKKGYEEIRTVRQHRRTFINFSKDPRPDLANLVQKL